jgi:hypothetical protein
VIHRITANCCFNIENIQLCPRERIYKQQNQTNAQSFARQNKRKVSTAQALLVVFWYNVYKITNITGISVRNVTSSKFTSLKFHHLPRTGAILIGDTFACIVKYIDVSGVHGSLHTSAQIFSYGKINFQFDQNQVFSIG